MSAKHPFCLLVVDDEKSIQRLIRCLFNKHPYQVITADSGEQALAILESQQVDLMLLDHHMRGMTGLETLEIAITRHPDLLVVMLTGCGGVKEAVTAIKLGAVDFYEKPVDRETLLGLVDRLNQELQNIKKKQINGKINLPEFSFPDLVGESVKMVKLKSTILRVAQTSATVLIQGDSGTGKELVARAIHHHSSRKHEAFIPVDCAALGDTIIESELFGHVKGAFTGADQSTLGLFRAADKGTLFLDEVGELPLKTQAKLLRTLQERQVRPVGRVAPMKIDVRIIAATNRNLIEATESGTFRLDLFYRLAGVLIAVPPLRERLEDLPLLCTYIIKRISEKEATSAKGISGQAMQVLRRFSWNGNVRELENVIRSALIFSSAEAEEIVEFPFLNEVVFANGENTERGRNQLADYEETAIREALQSTQGNRREAAKLLNISEATLYRRLRLYGA